MRALAAITVLFATSAAIAEEANVILQSTVSGNQEQLRVMCILPWQQPGAAECDFALHNGIAEDLTWDPDAIVTEQVFYRSQDGTRIPP